MTISGEISQVDKWSQQALERLQRDSLLPSPTNYAVYYHYVAGDIPGMNALFDLYGAHASLTQPQCTELFDRYISNSFELAFYKDANSVIDSELKKVMDMLVASNKDTNQFGEDLTQFSGQLSKASSLEALREAVEKITEETRVIAAQNHKLQNELHRTTSQLSEMRDDFDRVHKESQIDPLTEVGNRKFFDREIARAMSEAREKKTVLSVLMVDIDHFKKFNDMYGHLIGDQVLRLVARTFVENLKGRDIISRFGGEEFVIILPQTRLQDSERVANQLRAGLGSKNITKRGSREVLGVVTVSVGAAEYIPGEDIEALISRADAALYKAKQTRRNKVVCATPDTVS